MQLGKQKPRPVTQLKPLIEEDFLMHSDKKWREKLDEKGMKKKIKKEEKMVMRELKKDTIALQAEKQKIRS